MVYVGGAAPSGSISAALEMILLSAVGLGAALAASDRARVSN